MLKDKDNEVKILDYSNELQIKVYGKTNFLEFSISIKDLEEMLYNKYETDKNLRQEIREKVKKELEVVRDKYCLECEDMIDIFKNLFYSKLLDYKKEMEEIYKKYDIK